MQVSECSKATFSLKYSLESANTNIGGHDAFRNRRSGFDVRICMRRHLSNLFARVMAASRHESHPREPRHDKEPALSMSSQHHLKEALRNLGYFPSDDSEIPDIPAACLTLVTTLVDDLSHSQSRISRLTTELEAADTKLRDLNLHVPSPSISLRRQLM